MTSEATLKALSAIGLDGPDSFSPPDEIRAEIARMESLPPEVANSEVMRAHLKSLHRMLKRAEETDKAPNLDRGTDRAEIIRDVLREREQIAAGIVQGMRQVIESDKVPEATKAKARKVIARTAALLRKERQRAKKA